MGGTVVDLFLARYLATYSAVAPTEYTAARSAAIPAMGVVPGICSGATSPRLSRYSEAELDAVAFTLNGRPRKTLTWATPAETLNQLLSTPPGRAGVATTP